MTFVFAFLLAAFALILALMPLARGAPAVALSRLNNLQDDQILRDRRRQGQHSKCGPWATVATVMKGRRNPLSGFSLAAGGVAA
jgi:hypothetical protein